MAVATIGKRPYTFKELLKLLQASFGRTEKLAVSSVASGFYCNPYFLTKMTDEEAMLLNRLEEEMARKDPELHKWCKPWDVLSLLNGPLGPSVRSYKLFAPPDDHRYRFARETPCVELQAGRYTFIVQARFYFTLVKRHPGAVAHVPGRDNYSNHALLFLEDGEAVGMLMGIHLENHPFPAWNKSDYLFTYNHRRLS